MIDPYFLTQCMQLQKALGDLPFVHYVDALPTNQIPTETTVVVSFVGTITLSDLASIIEFVVTHLGNQSDFEIEVGSDTLVITGLKSQLKVTASGVVYVNET